MIVEDRGMGWTAVRITRVGLLLLGSALAGADPLDRPHPETTVTATALSATERRQAQYWQLSEAEWQRYQISWQAFAAVSAWPPSPPSRYWASMRETMPSAAVMRSAGRC